MVGSPRFLHEIPFSRSPRDAPGSRLGRSCDAPRKKKFHPPDLPILVPLPAVGHFGAQSEMFPGPRHEEAAGWTLRPNLCTYPAAAVSSILPIFFVPILAVFWMGRAISFYLRVSDIRWRIVIQFRSSTPSGMDWAPIAFLPKISSHAFKPTVMIWVTLKY
jgi:hypothetical protein